MKIKEDAKINKVGLSGPSGRPYFDIQFDDDNVDRVYLKIRDDLLISRVFVVNDNNKPIRLSLDNLVLLYWINCSTCDIVYDVRTVYKNVVCYARDIFLIVNDKDYKYIAEKVNLGVGKSLDEGEEEEDE